MDQSEWRPHELYWSLVGQFHRRCRIFLPYSFWILFLTKGLTSKSIYLGCVCGFQGFTQTISRRTYFEEWIEVPKPVDFNRNGFSMHEKTLPADHNWMQNSWCAFLGIMMILCIRITRPFSKRNIVYVSLICSQLLAKACNLDKKLNQMSLIGFLVETWKYSLWLRSLECQLLIEKESVLFNFQLQMLWSWIQADLWMKSLLVSYHYFGQPFSTRGLDWLLVSTEEEVVAWAHWGSK